MCTLRRARNGKFLFPYGCCAWSREPWRNTSDRIAGKIENGSLFHPHAGFVKVRVEKRNTKTDIITLMANRNEEQSCGEQSCKHAENAII